MKLRVCDICYKKDKKTVEAKYIVGYPGMKLDVCKKHQKFGSDMTQTEFGEWIVKNIL